MQKVKRNRSDFLKKLLFWALAAVSILLTASYFIQYIELPIVSNIHPILATVAVLGLGLLAADVGALAWRSVLHNNCRSAAQVNIAYAMIAVTLTMATATTVFGIADAFNGAELIPASWHEWMGWLIVGVIALEFVGGAFLFSFFDPEQRIAREIMAAVVDDAEETAQALTTKLTKGRADRVATLSSQLANMADGLIMDSLAVNAYLAQQQRPQLGAVNSADTDALRHEDDVIDGESHTIVADSVDLPQPPPRVSGNVPNPVMAEEGTAPNGSGFRGATVRPVPSEDGALRRDRRL